MEKEIADARAAYAAAFDERQCGPGEDLELDLRHLAWVRDKGIDAARARAIRKRSMWRMRHGSRCPECSWVVDSGVNYLRRYRRDGQYGTVRRAEFNRLGRVRGTLRDRAGYPSVASGLFAGGVNPSPLPLSRLEVEGMSAEEIQEAVDMGQPPDGVEVGLNWDATAQPDTAGPGSK